MSNDEKDNKSVTKWEKLISTSKWKTDLNEILII